MLENDEATPSPGGGAWIGWWFPIHIVIIISCIQINGAALIGDIDE